MTSKTIVLIHGLWMTPRSWGAWVEFYEARGFTVHAPAYPGLEVEVEALRKDSTPIAELTVKNVIDHLASFVSSLPEKPILIGHSFGGALVQLLLDRGLGVAGVAIDSAPVKGVLTLPWSQVKALFPVLKSPGNKTKAVPLTPKEFHYAFTNTLTREESDVIHEKFAVAGPGRIVFAGATVNFESRPDAMVDYAKADRAPLLFIAGEKDHIMPPKVNLANARKYESGVVAFKEFAGRDHFTCGEAGWEAVATFALEWAQKPSAFGVK
ncbi:MAG: alpha/beta hydrolase [Archangium sp.]